MLIKTTELAIQTLVYLAVQRPAEPLSPREIAERLGFSPTYLAKTTAQLVRADILKAHRGALGGVTLSRPTVWVKDAGSVIDLTAGTLRYRTADNIHLIFHGRLAQHLIRLAPRHILRILLEILILIGAVEHLAEDNHVGLVGRGISDHLPGLFQILASIGGKHCLAHRSSEVLHRILSRFLCLNKSTLFAEILIFPKRFLCGWNGHPMIILTLEAKTVIFFLTGVNSGTRMAVKSSQLKRDHIINFSQAAARGGSREYMRAVSKTRGVPA